MTEKEKMLNQMMYNGGVDEELAQERMKCKDLCYEFNNIHPSQIEKQKKKIKEIVGKTKSLFYITGPFWCDYGYNSELGENFFMQIERRNAWLEYAYPITVGNNVWIGGGVRVMPGVNIGNNVVIGGGSVVTKDIPDNVVAVGNPCRVIREITEEDKNRNYSRR